MEIYLVGGAIRDKLLGLDHDETEKDYDIFDPSLEGLNDMGYEEMRRRFIETMFQELVIQLRLYYVEIFDLTTCRNADLLKY